MDEQIYQEVAEGIKTLRETYERIEKEKAPKSELEETKNQIFTRLEQIEAKVRKPSLLGTEEKSEAYKAFSKYLWTGSLSPEEIKLLREADGETKTLKLADQTAGYIAPVEFVTEIIKGIAEYSPLRQYATVRTTSNRAIQIPKRTGTFTAQWVAETGTRSETTGLAYGLEEIPAHELYALVEISFQALEDAAFNLEEELTLEFAEQFGKAEGTAFISGNAVKKPEGILMRAGVAEVNSGNATSITADGIIKLYFKPKSVYAKTGAWLMNRNTMLAASLLKDAQDRYLLVELPSAPGWTILGSPVIESPDMPDVASNSYPVAYGDWKKAYMIVDRIDMAILRDPYSHASSGTIVFHARKRVGGQVVLPEAFAKLKIAA